MYNSVLISVLVFFQEMGGDRIPQVVLGFTQILNITFLKFVLLNHIYKFTSLESEALGAARLANPGSLFLYCR